jgi:hypothetical protein
MHAQTLADLLADTAETRQGRLFFPPLTPYGQEIAARPPHTEAVLTVITMSGLVLPNPNVPREHWSFTERMSVPALHLASWYATRAVYGLPRHVRKVLALDECHFLAMWPVGRALFQRVGRDTRKYNVCCLAASQDPADTLNMDVANHVAASFVGRIEDERVAADALRLLGVPTDAGYEHAVGTLSQPGPDGTPPDYREFVFRDRRRHVDRFRGRPPALGPRQPAGVGTYFTTPAGSSPGTNRISACPHSSLITSATLAEASCSLRTPNVISCVPMRATSGCSVTSGPAGAEVASAATSEASTVRTSSVQVVW